MRSDKGIAEAISRLFREASWGKLLSIKGFYNLVFTQNGWERRDNRTVINVGKPAIKFKFEKGNYIGGTVRKSPREESHISVSTTGKEDRVSWLTYPSGKVVLRTRQGKIWGDNFRLDNFFSDVELIEPEDIALLRVLLPSQFSLLPELLEGLDRLPDSLLKHHF